MDCSPSPAPRQTPRFLSPAAAASASPSASWPPFLAAPGAASCGLSGSPWTPSAAGSRPEPTSRTARCHLSHLPGYSLHFAPCRDEEPEGSTVDKYKHFWKIKALKY